MQQNQVDNFMAWAQKNTKKKQNIAMIVAISVSLMVSFSLFALSLLLAPALFYFFAATFMLVGGYIFKKLRPIKEKKLTRTEVLKFLELSHSKNLPSPAKITCSEMTSDEVEYLTKVLNLKKNDLIDRNSEFVRQKIKIFALTLLGATLSFWFAHNEVIDSISHVIKVAQAYTRTSHITILEGKSQEGLARIEIDGGDTQKINLLPENLIQITVSIPLSTSLPTLIIKPTEDSVDQSDQVFQMDNVRTEESGKIVDKYYTITFSVDKTSTVLIPELSSTPVAEITVKKLPVPEVIAEFESSPVDDPWPDDKPLAIKIKSFAKNNLRTVKFLIRTSGKESEELVANILKDNQQRYEATYDLLLEPYVDQDIADVEITAIATDRTIPEALIGFSNTLKVKTASAYGRYQTALQAFKELKSKVDEAKEIGSISDDTEMAEKLEKATSVAQNTPFFDVIDRMTIRSLVSEYSTLTKDRIDKKTILYSMTLDEFLFEHEMLDDRERDRDFFVAIRSLSRIIAKPTNKRNIDARFAINKILDYLSIRRARWKIRLQRIPEDLRPKTSQKVIADQPFAKDLKAVDRIEIKLKNSVSDKSPIILSKLVPKYRVWIEQLEEAEDQARKRNEKNRQQSLKKQENKLKELQKKQGKISQSLDKAASQDSAALKKKWPDLEKKQGSLIKETTQVMSQMMMMAPEAAERIAAAAEAMGKTIQNGGQGKFVNAESMSDLAGRLLSQAQSKAKQRRNQSSSGRQRQRRRVSGDNYFGKSIVGGDVVIERSYEVDKRYREQILDEVRSANSTKEEKRILNKYLRETVR